MDCVEWQAKAVADLACEQLETRRSRDHSGQTITMRVRGAQFADAFAPVIEAVDAVLGTAPMGPQASSAFRHDP